MRRRRLMLIWVVLVLLINMPLALFGGMPEPTVEELREQYSRVLNDLVLARQALEKAEGVEKKEVLPQSAADVKRATHKMRKTDLDNPVRRGEALERLAEGFKQHKKFVFRNALVLDIQERPCSFRRRSLSLMGISGSNAETTSYFATSLYIKVAVGVNKVLCKANVESIEKHLYADVNEFVILELYATDKQADKIKHLSKGDLFSGHGLLYGVSLDLVSRVNRSTSRIRYFPAEYEYEDRGAVLVPVIVKGGEHKTVTREMEVNNSHLGDASLYDIKIGE